MTDAFWAARPALQHVLTLARARRVGPWATLAVILARANATVPPTVTLPKTVGGSMSLNLFVAPVGPSGSGKGASTAAAMEGVSFGGPLVQIVPLGSGEGVARTFRPPGTKPDEPNSVAAAIFDAPEIDSLAAIASRQGSTLSAELRKLYSGEALGFANASKDTRNIVAAGSYRAALVLGVQPLRSHALLGASDGGLPQRFIFMPTTDPDCPDDPPPDPGVWHVRAPAWKRPAAGHLHLVGDQQDLTIPEAASKAIIAHRQAVLREDKNVDPLDGHALLTRLKVAAALMALDGRTVVSGQDWSLAGYVMDVSNYTRERCQRALIEQSRSTNTARALAAADREEILSDRRHQRCKESVLRWVAKLADGSTISRQQLTRSIKSDVRDCFDAAIGELIAEGRITAVRTPRGVAYHGPTVDHGSNPPEQRKHGLDHGPTLDHRTSRKRQRTRGKYRDPQQTGEATA